MTAKEAINWIRATKSVDPRMQDGLAMSMAIIALSKQIPCGVLRRSVKRWDDECHANTMVDIIECASCNSKVGSEDVYCASCGQLLGVDNRYTQ